MKKAFTFWRHKGTAFLAINRQQDSLIIDESYRNYGAWMSVTNFRRSQSDALGTPPTPIGNIAEITVRIFNEAYESPNV